MAEIMEAASELTFGVWFLIGAALVFFMQCGFAMVEAGFTRAKNAGNIIMKNLMDFCIGSVVFVTLGSGLMLAEDYIAGVIGVPNLDIFTNWETYDWSGFVFNLVFCATAATIVSGAMAERTKFSAYCIYSAVISAVVYPIEAGWVWNSQGWLYKLGFIDYAGSAAIHMVGGTAALIGAIFLGPRIGKYVTNKDGKKEARAIPGHSITIGALGVFILWFGWYGFNGAAATDIATLGKIFVTTTLAPAFASCATMAFTWIKNGKPDVSMTLNGSLAGLVAITAGCANVDALGSIIIGLVAGIWVVVVVEVLDLKLHVDDPVGAVGVHFANGIWGTLAVGLFSTDTGLFYGGGFRQLGVQALGVVAILAYTTVLMVITFSLIKKFHGLRVAPEEEISGLDSVEHGLASAYAGFEFALDPTLAEYTAAPAKTPVPVEVAVPVTDVSAPKTTPANGKKITKVEIICKESRFEALKAAMDAVGITGMTVTKVLGCGIQKGKTGYYRGVKIESMDLNPKVQVDIVVSAVPVRTLVEAAKKALYTGNIGDGKIFVYDVENVIKVRTGEEGFDALQGDEQF
ncbi:MAG: ammonium transporter [Candidatus Fimenecus sp.]